MTAYQNIGTEWANDDPLNTTTEQQTTIEALPGGGYVVAWVDGNGPDNNIRAQIFNALGQTIGTEFIVSDTAQPGYGVKFNIDIQTLSNGNFVVAWDQTGAGANGNGIFARVFDQAGAPHGDPFLAGTYADVIPNGGLPNIVAAGGDEFWVISTSEVSYTYVGNLFAQKFDSDGNLITDRAAITPSYETSQPGSPSAINASSTKLANGDIAVVWAESRDGGFRIVEQVFDPSFAPVSAQHTVDTFSANNGTPDFAIAQTSTGGFAVSWSKVDLTDDAASGSVRLQLFDNQGATTASLLPIDSETNSAGTIPVDVTLLADGNIAVSWNPVSEDNTRVQIVDPFGAKIGPDFAVSDYDYQRSVGIAGLSGGGFATTSLGVGLDGFNSWEVRAGVFNLTSPSATNGDDIIVLLPGHVGRVDGLDGNDHIYGNDADNEIWGGKGDDVLIGGDGDDYLIDADGQNVFYGGEGNDIIGSFAETSIIDGGAGDDIIVFYGSGPNADKVTGGTGRDTFDPSGWSYTTSEITDFTPGATGDTIRLGSLPTLSKSGYSGNPFGTGHLRLLQSGPDTLLQYDPDGSSNGPQFVTVLTLKNVITSDLTKENFGGFPPDGSIAPGQTINGTTMVVPLPGGGSTIIDVSDTLTGTVGDDIINGLGGDDTLKGGYGSDIIDGGAGNDHIDGDLGDDTLIGGEGNDTLEDFSGRDAFYGGNGQDTITAFGDSLIVEGGADDDLIRFYFTGTNTTKLTGGSGKDTFEPLNTPSSNTAVEITDFTPGNTGDVIKLIGLISNSTSGNPFATGHLRLIQSGNDTLLQSDYSGPSDGVQFVTVLTLKNVTASTLTKENFDGYLPLINPQITGSGNDTLNSAPGIDALVGGAGNDKYYVNDQGDVVVEYGNQGMDEVYTSVSYSLSDNIENLILTGNGGINGTGNALSNFLKGNDGANVLEGGEGDDSIYGGLGRDTASYEHAETGVTVDLTRTGRQSTGAGDDLLNSIENLLGSAHNDTLKGNAGDNILDGGEGDDTLEGGKGSNNLLGGNGNDTASYASATSGVTVDLNITVRQNTGGGGFDYISGIENLIGSGHNDVLKGKFGASVLTGGLGADQFVFLAPKKGVDQVTDFSHAQGDKLVFVGTDYGISAGHNLTAAEFINGTSANAKGAQFIFNANDHSLYWDADGKGGAAAIKLATLDDVSTLSASDFLFV